MKSYSLKECIICETVFKPRQYRQTTCGNSVCKNKKGNSLKAAAFGDMALEYDE